MNIEFTKYKRILQSFIENHQGLSRLSASRSEVEVEFQLSTANGSKTMASTFSLG